MIRSSVFGFVLLCSLVVVSGCRTYGGYDSEEATYEQIQRSIQLFEEDIRRARSNAAALQEAAGQNPALGGLASHYAIFVEAGEALLDHNRSLAADLSPGSSYRSLHRAHGAIMAQQATARSRFEGLLQTFSEAYAPDTTAGSIAQRPYALIPPYYARVTQQQDDISVNDVLRMVNTTAPPQDFVFAGPSSDQYGGPVGVGLDNVAPKDSAQVGESEGATETAPAQAQ